MGHLAVVGLGPGPDTWQTPAALSAISNAEALFGYGPYVDRIADRPGQIKYASDNREELDRARAALEMASKEKRVAIVSGGDPGVFAMASAVCEAIDTGPENWRNTIELQIEPGVTAMLAAAARVGAPLGHDFAAISLSNLLKPWSVIENRLRLTSEAGLALALYNPASKTRKNQIQSALEILIECRGRETVVVLAKSIGRDDETLTITNLGETCVDEIDMKTLLIVGTDATRTIERANKQPLVYTERFVRTAKCV